MFCTKCGAMVPDGSVFCTQCGEKLSQTENEQGNTGVWQTGDAGQAYGVNQEADAGQMSGAWQAGDAGQAYGVNQEADAGQMPGAQQAGNVWSAAAALPPSPEQQKKNTSIIIAGIAGFVLVMAVIVIFAVTMLKPGINLTSPETVEVEFSGGDTRGKASCKVDYDKLDDIGEKVIGKNPSDKKALLWFSFIASISYDIDPDSDLSNGDKITLSATWDEKAAKQLGIRVKGKDRKITVSELPKATEVDVFKSLEVSFEGYNGNGKVDIDDSSTDEFNYNIYFNADKRDGLSNGDKVIIKAEVSDSALNKYNYILKETEREYTVSGLEEMQELDLFSGLSVEYSGTSPYGELDIEENTDNEFIDYYVSYKADNSTNLKNGDVITITAYVDTDYAADYGYIVGETTKQFTVEGLDEYIGSYSDITEETMKKMESQAEDAIDTWIASQENWYEYQELKIKKPEHFGDCFLKLKDGLTYGWGYSFENAVYMCYKAEKTFKENDRQKKEDVYLIVRYDDFLKYSDGTIYVEIVDASVENTTYGTYEDFFEKEIRAKKEDYTVEEFKAVD